jgi:excinuclease ABC subunit C
VGKAINLKKRVSQYFQRDDALGPKTQALVSQIAKIETQTVESEIEALVLEAALIKKYQPKYNSLLKDDRSYVYISISQDKLPLIQPAFKSRLNPESDYYGPFPNGRAVKVLLKAIRYIFPFYSRPHPPRPCLYCHLQLCPGPNPNPAIYRRQVGYIKRLLRGRFHHLLVRLNSQMKHYSDMENYEAAARLRDQIDALKYVTSGWRSLGDLQKQIELPSDIIAKTERELVSVLSPFLAVSKIDRLEAYDISNLGANYFVGSMVVYQQGRIFKNEYRKFRIKTKDTPDDQFMIKEVLWRRLRHPEWVFPDLIMVDGGKPQVSAASQILKLHFSQTPNKQIPVIGLAKKQETIVIKQGEDWQEINLPPHSPALRLLQSLRDEAHRFANRYRQELIKNNSPF